MNSGDRAPGVRAPVAAERATVLVVGVGGIGTPCAWALADAGVGRLVLVDPDEVEPSNLPRQILFAPADVGRAKATVAAERLARPGLALRDVVARFDARTAPSLLAGADVVVDATDGATTKDLVQRLTVQAGVPFVHAAALGSEGRVLDVAAGGRPCLACLFGPMADDAEGDTCARYGVFPGVTGTVGALAAMAVLDRLSRPNGPSRGLRVLDLAASHAVTLTIEADLHCPVCGQDRARGLTSPSSGPDASRGEGEEAPSTVPACLPAEALDLREEACPMNLLRARRAVDALEAEASLEIWLGEEGAATVPEGLASLGHRVVDRRAYGPVLRLRVRRRTGTRSTSATAGSTAGSDAWLRRYARQIVLPEVGEDGQRRLRAATVRLCGAGPALVAAAVHLACAGVGTLEIAARARASVGGRALPWPFVVGDEGASEAEALARALAGRTEATVRPRTDDAATPDVLRVEVAGISDALPIGTGGASGPRAQAHGALVADAAMRAILGGKPRVRGVRVLPDGTVASS